MEATPSLTAEDLPRIYRENYLHAIGDAREQHDPATEWAAFCEHLWAGLVGVFGLEDSPQPGGAPSEEPTLQRAR